MRHLILRFRGNRISDIRLELGKALLLGENTDIKFSRPQKSDVFLPARNLGQRILGEGLGGGGVRL